MFKTLAFIKLWLYDTPILLDNLKQLNVKNTNAKKYYNFPAKTQVKAFTIPCGIK